LPIEQHGVKTTAPPPSALACDEGTTHDCCTAHDGGIERDAAVGAA
jgi:hypothetical protein